MGYSEGSGAPASRPRQHPDRRCVRRPTGVDGVLFVGAEHGDVVIHVDVASRPFCALVLTTDDALTLCLGLCARVVDERRRPS